MYIINSLIVVTDSELEYAFKSAKNFDKFYSKKLKEVVKQYNKSLTNTLIEKYNTNDLQTIVNIVNKKAQ